MNQQKTETMFDRLIDYIVLKTDNIIAFVTGDLFVSIIVLQLHPADALLKVAGVFTLGVVGGFAGLVGKKLFTIAEDYLKNKFKKK